MKKLAIFVEGQTEQLFVEWLLEKIIEEKKLILENSKKSPGQKKLFEFTIQSQYSTYFVFVTDCGSYTSVKSEIKKQHISLSKQGYQKIIGLRDAHPDAKNLTEVPKLRTGLITGLPPNIVFILSIMEIEAWILAEYTHITKMHPKITVERIKQAYDIDLMKDDLSQRTLPAQDLKNIYKLENIRYDKKHNTIKKILSTLDHSCLKNVVCPKFPDLQNFCQELAFFFQEEEFYKNIQKLKGKISFSINTEALREE